MKGTADWVFATASEAQPLGHLLHQDTHIINYLYISIHICII